MDLGQELRLVLDVEMWRDAAARIPAPPDHCTFDDGIPGGDLHTPLLQVHEVEHRAPWNLDGDAVAGVGRILVGPRPSRWVGRLAVVGDDHPPGGWCHDFYSPAAVVLEREIRRDTVVRLDLAARGVRPGRRRLFVVEGSKALRSAIDEVYGVDNLVQRCRNHKLRNGIGHLPKAEHDQVKAVIRAAWKLDAKEGIAKLEKLACWLERERPSAAASLREGLQEMFTINRLGLPAPLRRCLGTTNLIDSTHSGARQKTRRVTNWQGGEMALRWAAAAFVETEKSYRRILGYRHLWVLKAHLDDHEPVAQMRQAS